jgi:hypothetical protein
MCPDRRGMQTGGICCQRRDNGCWPSVGLHPADYASHATTAAGYQAFAANRSPGRGSMQAAESKLWDGPRGCKITTERTDQAVGHIDASLPAAAAAGPAAQSRRVALACHANTLQVIVRRAPRSYCPSYQPSVVKHLEHRRSHCGSHSTPYNILQTISGRQKLDAHRLVPAASAGRCTFPD